MVVRQYLGRVTDDKGDVGEVFGDVGDAGVNANHCTGKRGIIKIIKY